MQLSFRFALTVLLALVLLSPTATIAQVLYGSLLGNVRDQSDAAVSGATVTVTHKETGQVRTATTNELGIFTFATIQSGTLRRPRDQRGIPRRNANRSHGRG